MSARFSSSITPPYLHDRDEDEHYDNIAEPGRSWLLDLIARSGPEALFAGHVHNFWYNRFAETDCYAVPSVGFVRSDFAELFRVEPADEFGRNDAPKLGYLLIDVYERGHAFRLVRTGGRTADPGASTERAAAPAPAPATADSRARPTVGVELRQAWADATEITASGHPDEFGRKRARNDYALLALQEMGVVKLRVPLQDLDHPVTRARMGEFIALGHAFAVHAFGTPDAGLAAFLGAHRELVRGVELVRHLNEALAGIEGDLAPGAKLAEAGCRVCAFRTPDAHYALILPDGASSLAGIALAGALSGAAGEGAVTRLDSGVVARIAWRGHGAGPEAGLRFATPLQCDAPALFSIPVHAIAPAPQP